MNDLGNGKTFHLSPLRTIGMSMSVARRRTVPVAPNLAQMYVNMVYCTVCIQFTSSLCEVAEGGKEEARSPREVVNKGDELRNLQYNRRRV